MRLEEIAPNTSRLRLENGITLYLKEIHTAPLISHWVWYRVGARNEQPGLSGLSHWVEHMQFKGTRLFPNGLLDKAISRTGGSWNAFTSRDSTAYYETLPAAEAELALRLEADRMMNSLFDPDEVESERTVILSEREGSENEPQFRLDEALLAAAFDRHPYRNEVIGSVADLKRITRDDLYQHYLQYYAPANALVSLAGDFETREMAERLEQIYGAVPARVVGREQVQSEPALQEERRVMVEGPGHTVYLRLAYRAPAGGDDDHFPMSVLDSLLCGPGNMNKTTRMYQALVLKDLVTGVYGDLQLTLDPYLYTFGVTLRPGVEWKRVLQVLEDEIHRVQDELISPDEIHKAVKQERAFLAYESERISNHAYWMGSSEMFASYAWYLNYLQRLEQVTPEDVQRAARKYFDDNTRVIGVYQPTGGDEPYGDDGEGEE